jgi:hypothetical protein
MPKRKALLTPAMDCKVRLIIGVDMMSDDETIRKVCRASGLTQAAARQYIWNLRSRGVCHSNVISHEGTTSFATVPAPRGSCGVPVLDTKQAKKLHGLVLAEMNQSSLQTPTSDGSGAKCRFFEVLQDQDVLKPEVFVFLLPFFPIMASILQKAVDGTVIVPLNPQRIFCNNYPFGCQSGMGYHCDNHVPAGAIVLSLTNDEEGGTLFFSNPSGTEFIAVPLQAGEAIAVPPTCFHGVFSHKRTRHRTTVNLFF